jgi:hypothetical protein
LNTVISLFWHPSRQSGVFQFHLHEPHWTLYLGIVLTGLGAALVLYSKELSERPSAAPAVQSTHAQLSPPIPPQSDTRIEAHRDGQ